MAAQPKNTICATKLRKPNSSRQPAAASGATIHTAGVRKLRWRVGSVRRSVMMARLTKKKAHSVPPFDTDASWPTGKKAAEMATPRPVMIVTTCGVPYFGCTFDNMPGSRPSRLITKNTRVCANIIMSTTDGSAKPAARPSTLPTPGWPMARSTCASASFEQTTGSVASAKVLHWATSSGEPGCRASPFGPNTGCAP